MTRGEEGTPAGAGLPVLSIGDAQLVEGHAGTTVVQFKVTLSSAANRPVSVHYRTEDGTALADQDYRPASGTIDFPPNTNATQSFDVTLIGESVIRSAKTFTTTLSDAVNATVAGRRGIATIFTNDKRPEVPPGNSVTLKMRADF